AQPVESLPQVRAALRLRPLRPEEVDQQIATVGPIGFNRQVDQQRPSLIGFEAGDRGSVKRDFKGAESLDRASGHGYRLLHSLLLIIPYHCALRPKSDESSRFPDTSSLYLRSTTESRQV